MRNSVRYASLALSITVAAAAVYAFSPRALPPFEPSTVRADRLHVNSIAVAGSRLVAVGEAGYILLSDDDGRHWRVAEVAGQTGSTLTHVRFSDDRHGVAVGHDGTILKTDDGGAAWYRVRFDEQHSEPLLHVAAVRERSGITFYAVGSFGRFLLSHDGGNRWEQAGPLPGIGDSHLNALVAGPGKHLMLAGENGLLWRSPDGGRQWEPVNLPYRGSIFGALALSPDVWLVFGMRGNVLRSKDFGASWEPIRTGVQTSFFGGTRLHDGRIVLLGQGGAILVSNDAGLSFTMKRIGGSTSLTDIVETASGTVLVAGEAGITAERL